MRGGTIIRVLRVCDFPRFRRFRLNLGILAIVEVPKCAFSEFPGKSHRELCSAAGTVTTATRPSPDPHQTLTRPHLVEEKTVNDGAE